MISKIVTMQDYASRAFEAIQGLNIQATESNLNAVGRALNALRHIYNILDEMAKNQEKEEQNGHLPDNA